MSKIYNQETSKLPNYTEAKVEDTIKRFKRETFDKTRMFYAYQDNEMVGYVGLTGKDVKQNLRSAGYPWLAEGTDEDVRDQLYEAMEKKVRDEGTKILRAFGSPQYPVQLKFFQDKDYKTKIEFLNLEKELKENQFDVPDGYVLRSIKKEDHLMESF